MILESYLKENDKMVENKIKKILNEDDYDKLKELRKVIHVKEKFLEKLLTAKSYTYKTFFKESRFIVARKWNSWYPSFFSAEGGCYVLIPANENQINNNSAQTIYRQKVIIIDPGFKFLDLIRKYNIEINDIDTIIVTHLHTDHMAGLIEYLTIVHKAKVKCNIYLNKTTFEFFKRFATDAVQFIELKDNQIIQLSKYKKSNGQMEEIYLEPISTYHQEIGLQSHSLGLIFTIRGTNPENIRDVNAAEYEKKIGILGDTDGHIDYIKYYVKKMKEVDILVLHLGTISVKNYGKGYKHLYENGIILLLQEIKNHPEKFQKLSTIILSEFGLELASLDKTVNSIRLFQYPNGWELIIYLVYSIIELNELKTNSDNNAIYFEYESDVFSKLFLNFLDTYNENDNSKHKEAASALSLSTIFRHYDISKKYYENISEELNMLAQNNYWTGKKQIDYKDFEFVDLSADFNILTQNIFDELMKYLYKNATSEKNSRRKYSEVFKKFIERLLIISLDAVRIKTTLQYRPHIKKSFMDVAKLYEMEGNKIDIKKIRKDLVDDIKGSNIIYGLSAVICYTILLRLDNFVKHPKILKSLDYQYQTSNFLYDFVDIISKINENVNIIVGDLGLELKIDDKIEGKYIDEEGTGKFEDIKEIKFEEDSHSTIKYIK